MLVKSSKTQWIGKQAEDAAALWLEQRGFVIIDRNVRIANGELDIIARKNNKIIFIEVKARRNPAYGPPEEAITPIKLKRLRSAMRAYAIRENLNWKQIRLDVLTLIFKNNHWLVERHIEDVLT